MHSAHAAVQQSHSAILPEPQSGTLPSMSRAAPAPSRAGYAVDIASIRGGRVPVDPASLHGAHARTSALRRFLEDGGRQSQGLGVMFSPALF